MEAHQRTGAAAGGVGQDDSSSAQRHRQEMPRDQTTGPLRKRDGTIAANRDVAGAASGNARSNAAARGFALVSEVGRSGTHSPADRGGNRVSRKAASPRGRSARSSEAAARGFRNE